MLNFEMDAGMLLPFVPAGTELDRWNGKSFVSLVGFLFANTRLFSFLPIPMHSTFEEVNLRFYVRRQIGTETRRGVVFIREIVPRRAIAFVARKFYNENYLALPMQHQFNLQEDKSRRIAYRWRSAERWSEIHIETCGNPELPKDGSMEQFITEHFWGYAAQPGDGCIEYRVTHPSWRVWQSSQAAFEGNAEMLYGTKIAAILQAKPQSAFLAEGSAITVMRGRKL